MSYITTYTRKHFDPVHPEAEKIDILDIAHALPLICRGNGHVSSFWSVGEHCIWLREGGTGARLFQASGIGLPFARCK